MSKNIIVEGVYTHLSSADFDYEYTMKQLDLYKSGVEKVKSSFDTIKYIHSSASNGLLNFDDKISNAVRPGIILYGFESFKGVNKMIDIRPICKLKTRIVFIKEVNKKESIGYSRKYKTHKKMRVATIPIGYADGFRRSAAKKGYVIVNGKKAKILGNICMDSAMIDVTNIDANLNDEVYIWDNVNQTIDDIARICDTINYEIMVDISDRVKRVFSVNKIK
jgi:alanine racemase